MATATTKSKSSTPAAKPDKSILKAKSAEAAAFHALEVQVDPNTAKLPIATVVTEPPIDRDPQHLDPDFRTRLEKVLAKCAAAGIPFKFHEGFRSVQRQQWLWGSGRPNAKPFGRPGGIVTMRDGVNKLSNHQGNGQPGSGCAADCYPLKNGKVTLNAPDATWKKFAEIAESEGLVAGYRWTKPHDPPHIELIKKG